MAGSRRRWGLRKRRTSSLPRKSLRERLLIMGFTRLCRCCSCLLLLLSDNTTRASSHAHLRLLPSYNVGGSFTTMSPSSQLFLPPDVAARLCHIESPPPGGVPVWFGVSDVLRRIRREFGICAYFNLLSCGQGGEFSPMPKKTKIYTKLRQPAAACCSSVVNATRSLFHAPFPPHRPSQH